MVDNDDNGTGQTTLYLGGQEEELMRQTVQFPLNGCHHCSDAAINGMHLKCKCGRTVYFVPRTMAEEMAKVIDLFVATDSKYSSEQGALVLTARQVVAKYRQKYPDTSQ